MIHSLYVHIPFCERKCAYCDFTSIAGVRGQREYAAALRAELRSIGEVLPGTTLHTVFIGGGTPSILDTALLTEIVAEIHASFTVAPDAEITMEANPSSTTARKAEAWRDAGVNRLSLGIQSLEADVLAFLERVHDADRAVSAVRAAQQAGFDNLNTDLIYAVPGLDDERWRRTLERILDLGCPHLSCYELIVEEGTPLASAVAAGAVAVADPDTALRQHWLAVELARDAGLQQYEISNFARPGRRCRHNLAYWHNDFYLAAGVGAHGHLPPAAAEKLLPNLSPPTVSPPASSLPRNSLPSREGAARAGEAHGVRYWHTESIAEYVAAMPAIAGTESVTKDSHIEESILVGLRLTEEGLPLDNPGARREAATLDAAGLIDWNGRRARVTSRGQELLDAVALRLVGACQ